jgi:hypothetical protein
MPNTGEDREIKRRATAHEAEVVRESKELARKTGPATAKNRKVKSAGVRRAKSQK